jgi:HPt (histidine-containing phosphotransfer) domain-containing protein
MEVIVVNSAEISKIQPERIWVQVPEGVPASLVTQYIQRCLTALPSAKAALERSDYAHMRVLGHRLKGSGGAYGIPALTIVGSGLEEAARQVDMPGLQRQLAELEALLGRIDILPQ